MLALQPQPPIIPIDAGADAPLGRVPPAAALANAIHRATGVRLRELPMTAERLYLAMQEAHRSGRCGTRACP